MRYSRILFLLVFCLYAFSLFSAPATAARPPAKTPVAPLQIPKRVLLISIDTLRPDFLSCYGEPPVPTPHIAALSTRGTTMDHAVAQVPLTLPSHTDILTGLYPTHHGVHDNGGYYLDQKIETLAEIFKKQGFVTAAFIGGFPLDSQFGLDQGFDTYSDPLPVRTANFDVAMPQLIAEQVVGNALDWLKSPHGNNWFVFLHLYDPHHPYLPPKEYRDKYPKRFYAGEIGYVDDQLQRVFDYLTDQKLMDSTLIVFTADHGEGLGQHKERTHGIFAYESTLHVPMIFAGPGVPQGKRLATLTRSIDIAPTILDIMHFPASSNMDGRSLVKIWTAPQEPPNITTYFEALSVSINRNWAPIRGFYKGDYKYTYLPVPELYHLPDDPLEQNNLCSSDADLCKQYQSEFLQFEKTVGVQEVATQEVDPEVAEKLRALGYVTPSSSSKTSEKEKFTVNDDPKNLVELDWMLDDSIALHNKGQDQKAVDLLEQLLSKRSDFTMAYLHQAQFYDELGEPQKSVETLKRSIANGTHIAETYARLGLYLQKIGHFEEAATALKQSIQMEPRDVEAINFLGITYTNAGQFAQAEATFQDAMKLDPTVAITYNNLGVMHLKQKLYEKALQDYQQAVKYDPQMAPAFNGMGVIYINLNQPQKAIESWQKAADVDPQQVDALLNIGYAYLKMNQGTQAAEAFHKFLDKAPPAGYEDEISKVQQILQTISGKP